MLRKTQYKKTKLEIINTLVYEEKELNLMKEGKLHLVGDCKFTVGDVPMLAQGYCLHFNTVTRKLYAIIELELAELKVNNHIIFPEPIEKKNKI